MHFRHPFKLVHYYFLLQTFRLGEASNPPPGCALTTHSAAFGEQMWAAWPRVIKRWFYGDRVITITWFKLNSHRRRTRYCVLK